MIFPILFVIGVFFCLAVYVIHTFLFFIELLIQEPITYKTFKCVMNDITREHALRTRGQPWYRSYGNRHIE